MNAPTVHIQVFVFVALAVILGHDALMSTGPHDTATMTHHVHAEVDHADVTHDSHEVTCHLAEGTRPAPPSEFEPRPTGAGAMPVPVAGDGQATALISWKAAPVKPPHLSRALLQVFLN